MRPRTIEQDWTRSYVDVDTLAAPAGEGGSAYHWGETADGCPVLVERCDALPPSCLEPEPVELPNDIEALLDRYVVDREEQEALWLLAQGISYSAIGKIIGWPKRTVYERCNKTLQIIRVGYDADKARSSDVDRALASLHDQDRKIWLIYADCASLKELAEMWGKPKSAMATVLSLIETALAERGCGEYLNAIENKRRVHLWGGPGNVSRVKPEGGNHGNPSDRRTATGTR